MLAYALCAVAIGFLLGQAGRQDNAVNAVAEDAVEGYSSEVAGDAKAGFTVTNTKDERPKAPAPGGKKAMPKTGDGTGAMALGAGLAGLLSLSLSS